MTAETLEYEYVDSKLKSARIGMMWIWDVPRYCDRYGIFHFNSLCCTMAEYFQVYSSILLFLFYCIKCLCYYGVEMMKNGVAPATSGGAGELQ